MIHEDHASDGVASEAIYSQCKAYRYALTRIWSPDAGRIAFIMLNPSTADAQRNDPTVERCQRRAAAMGFGAFRVCNIFAWRETSPKALKRADAPLGAENDRFLIAASAWADMVICGWGVHGAHLDRGREVQKLLRGTGHALHHLGLTKHGHPRHPLYVGYQVTPQIWLGDD